MTIVTILTANVKTKKIKILAGNEKILGKTFVDRNEILLPLPCIQEDGFERTRQEKNVFRCTKNFSLPSAQK
jgi:hypothetical protein